MTTEFQNMVKNPGLSSSTRTRERKLGLLGRISHRAKPLLPPRTGPRFSVSSQSEEIAPVTATQMGKSMARANRASDTHKIFRLIYPPPGLSAQTEQ